MKDPESTQTDQICVYIWSPVQVICQQLGLVDSCRFFVLKQLSVNAAAVIVRHCRRKQRVLKSVH